MNRTTRLIAVQYLYHIMVTNEDVNKTSTPLFMEKYSNKNIDISEIKTLISGILEKSSIIDARIQGHLAEDWKFERLGMIIKVILRLASFELIFYRNIDKPLIINEYLDIAKSFNHAGEVGFLNSVMDKVSNL